MEKRIMEESGFTDHIKNLQRDKVVGKQVADKLQILSTASPNKRA